MSAEQPYTLTRFIGELANTVAGLLVWATHFAVVYSVHAVACARGLDQWSDLRRMHHQHSDAEDSQRFLTYTSATVAGFSILAIVWVALPVLFIEPCTL
jgi:fatty-acid desaturase